MVFVSVIAILMECMCMQPVSALLYTVFDVNVKEFLELHVVVDD